VRLKILANKTRNYGIATQGGQAAKESQNAKLKAAVALTPQGEVSTR
jgi:hypothetical protein